MNDSDAIAIEKEEAVGEISDAAKIRSRFSSWGKGKADCNLIYFSHIAFEFPLADKFLFVLLQQSLRHKKAPTKGGTPEVVEITSEEGGGEEREKP